jgi:hypothetical protein
MLLLTRVLLQVHVNTNYGEQVWVCGSDDALGSWMPSKGVQVPCLLPLLVQKYKCSRPSNGVQLKTSADIYPLWTAQVLSLLPLLVQKYKY